jgi:hypothetical protein
MAALRGRMVVDYSGSGFPRVSGRKAATRPRI